MMGYSGLAFAVGIPGTVGGAVFMNAGAYGGSFGDLVSDVRCLDSRSGEPRSIPGRDCGFSYRTSLFQADRDLVVSGVALRLERGDRREAMSEASGYLAERRRRLPLDLPNCGSVFRRIEGGPPPGRLIEECGLKGRKMGGAMVSPLHANFIVNTGGATCRDILELMALIVETVREMTGFSLEREVEIIGFQG